MRIFVESICGSVAGDGFIMVGIIVVTLIGNVFTPDRIAGWVHHAIRIDRPE